MMSRRASAHVLRLRSSFAREAEIKKIAEKEAARTRKVIEELSGKRMSNDVKSAHLYYQR